MNKELAEKLNLFVPHKIFDSYFTIPDCLAEYQGLTSTAKLCWGLLNRFSGDKGNCYHSQEELGKYLGVTKQTIINITQELESKGFIYIEKPEGMEKVKHYNNVYWFKCHQIFIDDLQNRMSKLEVNWDIPLRGKTGYTSEGIKNILPNNKHNSNKQNIKTNSKEFVKNSQQGILKTVLLKKRKQTFDRNKFNGIPPSIIPVEKKIKPTVEVHSILDFWKNLGLKTPKEVTKTHVTNIDYLNRLISGKLLGKSYTKQQILDSIKNFALAATDYYYYPSNKKYLQKLYLHMFLINPHSDNGDKSMFQKYLENPPDIIKIPTKIVPSKNPIVAKIVKEWYLKDILGDAKIEFTAKDENNFAAASNKIVDFFENNKNNLRLGIHYPGIMGLARLTCEAIKSATKSPEMIKPFWLQTDETYSITLPKYLKAKDMIIPKWRPGI
jgi:DNA-binding transcriptional regulator YhcF (GntR family)